MVPAAGIVSVLLSVIFLAFVTCMCSDQRDALMTSTPAIDAMQGHYAEDGERSFYAGLKDAFGEPPTWRWLLPVPPPGGFCKENEMRKKDD